MKLKNSFKGFTLVEVLIVIIIVGILIAALLPRLQGSQAKARDTARSGHINQIASAAALALADDPSLDLAGCVGTNTGVVSYLSTTPTDPQGANGQQTCANGEYTIFTTGGTAGNQTIAVAILEDGNGNCDAAGVLGNTGAFCVVVD